MAKKKTEGWVSLDFVKDRWYVPTWGVARNLTNSFARPSSCTLACDPVEIVDALDEEGLAKAVRLGLERSGRKLGDVRFDREWEKQPGPCARAAGFASPGRYLNSGLRVFSVVIEAA